jgi:hypothetical protein
VSRPSQSIEQANGIAIACAALHAHQSDVHSLALVGHSLIRMQADACRSSVTDDGNALVTLLERCSLKYVDLTLAMQASQDTAAAAAKARLSLLRT